MENVYYKGQVLWSQIDANMHLRHSAYADVAAQARLILLESLGLNAAVLMREKLGPILFREELIYLKEVGMNDTVSVTCAMTKCRKDGSRWSFTQDIFRQDGVKAAIVHTDGAWLDTSKRKLTALPEGIREKFNAIPRTADFTED